MLCWPEWLLWMIMPRKRDIILIDGKNFCYRYHYTNKNLRDSHNRSTSVLHGALWGLLRLQKEFPNTPLVFVWDGGGKTWRHEITEGTYKSNRKASPDVLMVANQLPILRTFLRKIGCRQFKISKVEGDDLIGILATYIEKADLFEKIIIHSNDKDFLQLAARSRIHILPGGMKEKKWKVLDMKGMVEKGGCEPHLWRSVRALIGDSVDGIPGVKRGVGPKTALKMIAAGVDPTIPFSKQTKEIRKALPDLAGVWDKVELNYELVGIQTCFDLSKFPSGVRREIEEMLSKLSRRKFIRRPSYVTKERYQSMLMWLSKYDLTGLLARRRELWKLR